MPCPVLVRFRLRDGDGQPPPGRTADPHAVASPARNLETRPKTLPAEALDSALYGGPQPHPQTFCARCRATTAPSPFAPCLSRGGCPPSRSGLVCPRPDSDTRLVDGPAKSRLGAVPLFGLLTGGRRRRHKRRAWRGRPGDSGAGAPRRTFRSRTNQICRPLRCWRPWRFAGTARSPPSRGERVRHGRQNGKVRQSPIVA